MRALILVAGAALAVAACSNDSGSNTNIVADGNNQAADQVQPDNCSQSTNPNDPDKGFVHCN